MPDYGFGALAIGSGAQAGVQDLIKRRLLEREMALREQAQRESASYRNRDLDLRAKEGDEARALREAIADQNAIYQQGQLVNQAADNTPYDTQLDVPTAAKFKAYGQPVTGPSLEERVSPLANEEITPYQFKGNKPAEKPSKIMTPEELEQWKAQKVFEAEVGSRFRPPSSEAAGTWSDTGRTNAKGEAIYINSKTLAQRAMPFGSKPQPGSSNEADRKRIVVVDATNRTLNAIDELLDERGNLRPEVKSAIGGSRLLGSQYVPGTEAYNAQAAIDRLRARMVTDLMAELKSQSRTGATGFGQLNMQELKIMQDSAAKLDPGQGEQAFQKELQNIRRRLNLILQEGPSSPGGPPKPGGRFEIVR